MYGLKRCYYFKDVFIAGRIHVKDLLYRSIRGSSKNNNNNHILIVEYFVFRVSDLSPASLC